LKGKGDKISLADWLELIRKEVAEAQRRRSQGNQQGPNFLLSNITLEATVVTESNYEGTVGAKLWILTGEASTGKSSTNSHKVSVTMTLEEPELPLGDGD